MKRNVIIAIVAAMLAVVALWYFFLYAPLGDDLDQAKADVAAAESQQTSLKATLARLQATAKNSSELTAQLNKLDAAIPEQPDEAQFIIDANRIAEDAGIDFLSVAPAPPAAGGTASVIALDINISGSFFQVRQYLTDLEQLERLVIVDTISITSSTSDTTAETSLSVALTGRMFTRAAPLGGDATATGDAGTTTTTTGSSTDSSSTSSSSTPSSTTGGT